MIDLIPKVDDGQRRLGRVTLRSMRQLSLLYRATSRVDESIAILRQVLERYEQTYAKDHPDYIETQFQLASLLREVKQFEEAEAHCQDVVKARIIRFKEHHPKTLLALQSLAWVQVDLEKIPESVDTFERVAAGRFVAHGKTDKRTIDAKVDLAMAYERANMDQQAINLYSELLGLQRQHFGVDSVPLTRTLNRLADRYELLQDFAQAEPHRREILAICVQSERDPRELSEAFVKLALNLSEQQNFIGLEQVCAAHAESVGQSDETRWSLLVAGIFAGIALVGQDQYDEGETRARESYLLMKQNVKKQSSLEFNNSKRCIQHMIDTLRDAGHRQEAFEWRQRIGELTELRGDP